MVSRQGLNEGRLAAQKHRANISHSVEPKLRRELAGISTHLEVDMAHVVMLAEVGALDPNVTGSLLGAIREVLEEPPAYEELDPQRGSLVAQIEARLAQSVGSDVAHQLHTGRSRNDLHEAIYRLTARARLIDIFDQTCALISAILAQAEIHRDSWIPAYTHAQRAMPTTLGHYWLRHCYVLLRDLDRMRGLYRRVDLSALGGAAIVGTTWPIDRLRIAELLGHSDIVKHSTDSGIFGRDTPAEIASVLSILVNNVARPIGDIYLWASSEFGFVELDDSLCDTSSIMPQKKNPESVERVRGIAGMAIGWLVGVLATQRSALSTDMDLAYGLDPTGHFFDETTAALDLAHITIEKATFDVDRMAAATDSEALLATNLADRLVVELGLPFRDAHQLVGRAFRLALQSDEQGVTPSLMDRAAIELGMDPPRISSDQLAKAFDLEEFRRAMRSEGGIGSDAVDRMIAEVADGVSAELGWLHERRDVIEKARAALSEAVDEYIR